MEYDAVRHIYVLSQNGERESSSEITMIKWFHSKISIKNCYQYYLIKKKYKVIVGL